MASRSTLSLAATVVGMDADTEPIGIYSRRVVASDRVERRFVGTILKICLGIVVSTQNVYAWGDKGHEIIAHIAWHYLTPATREEIDSLLQQDDSGLTATDFASESTWADVYRDSDRDTTRQRFEQTKRWHYINLALRRPDFDRACFDFPALKRGQSASDGPAKTCAVDKIEQFARAWRSDKTDARERLRALQFLLHLIGDIHQPLHAADNDDEGGNDIDVSAKGFKRGSLHGYWDSAVVNRLGRKPDAIARKLMARIDSAQIERWQRGSARDWALEANTLARDVAYRLPPASGEGIRALDVNYAAAAESTAAQQLAKAGIRLAHTLESTLGH